MMMPSPELWNPDEVFVKTPQRVYTLNDYDDFFKDIGFPLGIKRRNLVKTLIYPLTAHAPNVRLHCLYGTGVHTAASYIFGEEYKSKNLHNVEWFFEGVLYLFSLVIQF